MMNDKYLFVFGILIIASAIAAIMLRPTHAALFLNTVTVAILLGLVVWKARK